MRRKHLIVLLVVVAGAWLLLRGRSDELPWNVGQAGSIFQPGAHMGGGQ